MCAERCARGKGHIFTCALCGYPAAFRREMVTHYEQHDIVFKQQRLSFPSMEEFCAWKDAFERQEGSKFVKPRADNKLKTCRKIYFACQTNGVYQAKTRVTVGFCPARMTASIDDVSGEVEVDFHATHVGHGPTVLAGSDFFSIQCFSYLNISKIPIFFIASTHPQKARSQKNR